MARVAIVVAAATLALGCLSPERKHRVLTFLFDGVPPLQVAGDLPSLEEPEGSEPLVVARKEPERPRGYQHGPYSQKACDQCHESRGSNRMLAEKSDLCFRCHESEGFGGAMIHGPLAAGDCKACHDPHKSPNEYLLVEDGPGLCSFCHDAKTFPGDDEHRAEQGEDCVRCHDPHSAGRAFMLRELAGPS
jgi:predicted CXXCH cytochrome family protein